MDGSPDALRPQGSFGRFRLLAELGRGGMGTVWRARDAGGREVALKVLLRSSRRALERFAREGQITAQLSHPGILRVHALGEEQGLPYLVYELVEGTTLEERLGHAPRPELLELLTQAARAVGHAHRQGVVHRDLTPSNVLVDAEGRARVADFGLAASLGLERLTETGTVLGTPQYMAPEQFAGRRDALDPATDVWALGVTLYRVLCGRLPFEAANMIELGSRVVSSDPAPPRGLDPEVSPALEALCLRALAKAPAERPPDAVAFADALEAARVGAAHPLTRPLRRRRRAPWAALLGLGGVGACLAAALYLATPREPVREPAPAAAPMSAALRRLTPLLERLPDPSATRHLRDLDPRALRAEPDCVAAMAATRLRLEAALLAELRRGDPPAPAVRDPLEAASALVELAPPGAGAPATSVPLMNALLPWATRRLELRDASPLPALEASAGLRTWITDRVASVAFTERVFKSFTGGTLEDDEFPRLLLLGVRIDLCLGPQSIVQAPLERLPGGHDPNSVYTRLRFSIGFVADGAHQQLLNLLRDPPPGLRLGPLNWAESVYAVLPVLAQPEREALARCALARDPRHAGLRMDWSRSLKKADDVEAALLQAEIALRLLQEQGFDRNPLGGAGVWPEGLRLVTRTAALLDRRERAREVFEELLSVDHNGAKQLAETYPWLAE